MGENVVEPVVVKKKQWWKSRTIWFNIGTTLVTAIDIASTSFGIPPVATAIVNLVGNTILRFTSDAKLTTKKGEETVGQ